MAVVNIEGSKKENKRTLLLHEHVRVHYRLLSVKTCGRRLETLYRRHPNRWLLNHYIWWRLMHHWRNTRFVPHLKQQKTGLLRQLMSCINYWMSCISLLTSVQIYSTSHTNPARIYSRRLPQIWLQIPSACSKLMLRKISLKTSQMEHALWWERPTWEENEIRYLLHEVKICHNEEHKATRQRYRIRQISCNE